MRSRVAILGASSSVRAALEAVFEEARLDVTFCPDVHGARDAIERGAQLLVLDVEDADNEVLLEELRGAARVGGAPRTWTETERGYRLIAEHSLDFISTHTPDGEIRYASPACRHLLQFEPEELVGALVGELVHPDDVAGVAAAFAMVVGGPDGYTFCYRIRRRDGEHVWFETTSQLVAGGSEAEPASQILSVSRDVTVRMRVEEELRESRAKLSEAREAAEAANRAKSTFLANMSHEIRTPMNAILGFGQLLASSEKLPETLRGHVETINHSGEHLLALINDVLEMSKIEAGRVELHPEVFDLPKLLRDLESMFRVRASEAGLDLVAEHAADLPRQVRADPVRLRQILVNLLSNAITFTPQGRVVLRVSIRGRSAEQVRLRAEVEDTGIGIPADALAAVFDPFEQTAGGASRGGTGLGLAITRSSVELMGGTMSLTSEIGRGSTFTVELPLELAAAGDVPVRAPIVRLADGQRRYRVLAVDDTESNLALLREWLLSAGFEVDVACDGSEALTLFGERRPDAVLMDLRMPVMDGEKAIQAIRASDGKACKIIVVTASAFDADRARVLALGADAFIPKPHDRAALLETLGDVLGASYLYEDPALDDGAERTLGPGRLVESLAGLSDELLETMRAAVERADGAALTGLFARVAEHAPNAAVGLQALADEFAYDVILGVLERARAAAPPIVGSATPREA